MAAKAEKKTASRGETLDAIFRPRSIAVVGASRNRQSVGGAVFANLMSGGFNGPVYPVNRHSTQVQSVRAYPSLRELPETPDLMVIAVPAAEVEEVVRTGAELGIKGGIILSAGFREAGEAGRLLEQRVLATARASGMRLLGPNCLGAQCSAPEVRLNATFAPTFAPYGKVAMASQSGALGLAALDYAKDLGIGFSAFASLGNKADISGNDVLEHLENDPNTEVIVLYLESLGNPVRFKEIATRVGRKKPIALVKSGRSGSGARAAGSHTGAMAGPDQAISALCAQTGIIRADTLEELFDVAMVLANQPLAKGRRVGVVTNAGGPGILAADALESNRLIVPRLSSAAEQQLRAVLRPEASVSNPVDVLADSSPAVYRAALQSVLDDSEIDAVLALYVPPITHEAEQMAQAIVDVAASANKPILSCFLGSHGVPAAQASLRANSVPSFRFPEGAARALALSIQYAEWRDRPASTAAEVVRPPPQAVQALAAARSRLGPEGGWMNMAEATSFAEAWGVALVSHRRVPAQLGAVEQAAVELGFPLVLKADVPGLVHKTEVGAVALGLADLAAVRAAAAGMMRLEPEAFVLQQQVEGGTEWLVGVVRDPTYGPLVAVGAGGTWAELWRDTQYRVAPLSEVDVAALVECPKIARTLRGWRGAPPADAGALSQIVRQMAAAACAHPDIGEMEINPVRVLPLGRGAMGLDLRVHLLKQK